MVGWSVSASNMADSAMMDGSQMSLEIYLFWKASCSTVHRTLFDSFKVLNHINAGPLKCRWNAAMILSSLIRFCRVQNKGKSDRNFAEFSLE